MTYKKRLERLQHRLQELDCDALIVDDTVNLYYLTGLDLSAGKILVYTRGAYLLVDSRYYEMCSKVSRIPVILTEPSRNVLGEMLGDKCSFIQTLAFDSESTSYQQYLELQAIVEKILSNSSVRKLVLKPLPNPIKRLRAIKDKEELSLLRDAAKLGSQGFDYICTLLKEGITEIEISTELEIFWKRRGSKGLAFEPIIAFGKNSSMPHYRAGEAKLRKGDVVLIDIGVNYHHYHSDMTRVVFFDEASTKMLKIYSIVQQAQSAALKLCRPGTTLGDLDSAARNVIVAEKYGERFTHSLGHGVGLDIHEYPTVRNSPHIKDIQLEVGMVITIEPGIYVPDLGGVRLEDTVEITADGYKNLTNRSVEPLIIKPS